MTTPPWPLLSLAELADVCHRCAHRPATVTDPDGTRRCTGCPPRQEVGR